ncbi:hypothetical protein LptCag_1852 [Leptospirillum ferriphilum]|uniref:Uncharacterized protein n=1 Tax=Leptospirillum ferriphilum TaxID=178606 RepID=A0A094WBW6_9BACT|nr:hypothetical protein LptCag_1852 [Leptospirillum ferriphilum]
MLSEGKKIGACSTCMFSFRVLRGHKIRTSSREAGAYFDNGLSGRG